MSVNTLDKKRLINNLMSKEFRQIFYAEHISTALPMQTRELRKRRKLSQAALAALVSTDQKNISDWENPNYEYKPQIGTLMRLADVFDVPLIVRFGSWEELWDWEHNLTPNKLAPHSFDKALPNLLEDVAREKPKRIKRDRLKKIKDTAQLELSLVETVTTAGVQNVVDLANYRTNRKREQTSTNKSEKVTSSTALSEIRLRA